MVLKASKWVVKVSDLSTWCIVLTIMCFLLSSLILGTQRMTKKVNSKNGPVVEQDKRMMAVVNKFCKYHKLLRWL